MTEEEIIKWLESLVTEGFTESEIEHLVSLEEGKYREAASKAWHTQIKPRLKAAGEGLKDGAVVGAGGAAAGMAHAALFKSAGLAAFAAAGGAVAGGVAGAVSYRQAVKRNQAYGQSDYAHAKRTREFIASKKKLKEGANVDNKRDLAAYKQGREEGREEGVPKATKKAVKKAKALGFRTEGEIQENVVRKAARVLGRATGYSLKKQKEKLDKQLDDRQVKVLGKKIPEIGELGRKSADEKLRNDDRYMSLNRRYVDNWFMKSGEKPVYTKKYLGGKVNAETEVDGTIVEQRVSRKAVPGAKVKLKPGMKLNASQFKKMKEEAKKKAAEQAAAKANKAAAKGQTHQETGKIVPHDHLDIITQHEKGRQIRGVLANIPRTDHKQHAIEWLIDKIKNHKENHVSSFLKNPHETMRSILHDKEASQKKAAKISLPKITGV